MEAVNSGAVELMDADQHIFLLFVRGVSPGYLSTVWTRDAASMAVAVHIRHLCRIVFIGFA